MSITLPADPSHPIAEAVSATRALIQLISNYKTPDAPDNTGNSHAVELGFFDLEYRMEMTNVLSFLSGTCLDPNHIKAFLCIDVVGVRPELLLAINQGVHRESEAELNCAADTTRQVFSLLATITPETKYDIRDEIVAVVAKAAWPRLCHHFGVASQPNCGADPVCETSACASPPPKNGNKDVRIPVFLPNRLHKAIDKIEKAGTEGFDGVVQDMRSLEKYLRRIFGTATTTCPNGDVCQDGTGVSDESKKTALLAVYHFYKTHKAALPAVLAAVTRECDRPDWIRRFENLAVYVEGVNFLCNLALGRVGRSGGRDVQHAALASSWFGEVVVTPYMLPEAAFLWDGRPDPLPTLDPPRSSLDASSNADADTDAGEASPVPPASPTLSTLSLSHKGDSSPAEIAGQASTLASVLTRRKLYDVYNTWMEDKSKTQKQAQKQAQKQKQTSPKRTPISPNPASDYQASYDSALGLCGKPRPKIHADATLAVALEELRALHGHQWAVAGRPAPAFYIASSKKACYCCDRFLRICGPHIVPPQSHATVYPAWRIPDARYLVQAVPAAARWPRLFEDCLWGAITAALGKHAARKETAAPRGDSEDIKLRTLRSVDPAAYWLDDRTPPSAPAPAQAPTSVGKRRHQPQPANSGRSARRKRAKSASTASRS